MATSNGKDATLYVGPTNPPTVKVASIKDPSFARTPVTADTTTNDSGMGDEHDVVRITGDFKTKALTDMADPGQVILRNAAKTGTKIYAEYREYGDGTGKPGERFLASVTFDRTHPINDKAATDFTLKPSGTVTTVAQ
ncbi:MAG TPA: hypothetical protein VGF99_15060 [Myxococcota bacterium]